MTTNMPSKSRREKIEVESHGGYMAEKIRKLDEQFHDEIQTNREKAGTSSKIFEGVSIHVNGYTDPSSDELKRLMMLHGGRYQHYYSLTKVTHIVATNLPYAKIRQLRNEKIVKPEWITDSIKAGSLLPSLQYELYKDRKGNQPTLQFSKSSKADANSEITGPFSNLKRDIHQGPNVEDASHGMSLLEMANASANIQSAGTTDNKPTSATKDGNKNVSMATAGDPRFLSEFYSNSRLHHISTWGAECKAYVNELQSAGDQNFLGKQRFLNLMEAQRKNNKDVDDELDDGDWQSTPGSSYPQNGQTGDLSQSAKSKGKVPVGKIGRTIMHVDMDCFFVSVGLINHPELVGKPVAVTHSKGQVGMSASRQEIRDIESAYYSKKYGLELNTSVNSTKDQRSNPGSSSAENQSEKRLEPSKETFHSMSEIASCNYEARKFGVKNGMFMGRAKTLCPDLHTIPYDFDGYKRVSQILYDTVASYTHEIEAVSCDEMFVDITSILEEASASPSEFAEFLRAEIREKTKCNASCGMGSNILLARMATRKAKPNGQFFLQAHEVDEFIKTQLVKDLPGVGRSMNHKLENLNIRTCGDLQVLSQNALQKEFGPKTGLSLYRFCRGIDDRPIKQERERKSVSAEVNYGIRFKQESDSEKFIIELASEVHKRLTAIKMQAKTITVKLKVRHPDAPKETSKFMGHGICEDKARSTTLGFYTEDVSVIQKECKKLLKEMQVPAIDMRGVGIQLSKLNSKLQSRHSNASSHTKSIADFMNKPKPAGDLNNSRSSENVSRDNFGSKSGSETLAADARFVSERSSNDSRTRSDASSKKGGKTLLNFVTKRPLNSSIQNIINDNNQLGQRIYENDNYKESDSIGRHGNQSDTGDMVTTPSKRRKKELPPLPRMPSESDSGTLEGHKTAVSTELSLPSPSEIDMSVLAALPEEIQQQILKDYKGKIQTVDDPDKPSTSAGTASVLPAIPPHLFEEGGIQPLSPDDISNDDDLSSLGVVEALPSFSQIDAACLEALPPELQEELREAYRQKAAVSIRRPPETSTNEAKPDQNQALETRLRGSPAKSPILKTSPSKSPFKIKKRGRPKKGSPRNKIDKPPWQMGIHELIIRNQTPPKQNTSASPNRTNRVNRQLDMRPSSDTNKVTADENVCSTESPSNSNYDNRQRDGVMQRIEDEEVKEETAEVNLCGAVQLGEVRTLLREWIASTDDPEDEDVGYIVQYLRELILDKNLEMVGLVIKSLKRLVGRRGCVSWMDAHETVVERIQHTLNQIYGAELKLS